MRPRLLDPRGPIALVCLLLAACSTLQAYEGPARPDPQVARLSPAIMPMRQILIQSFDGQSLGPLHDRVEMLPGMHKLEAIVTLKSRKRQLYFVHTLQFFARPGREYVLYAEFDLYGPRTFIVDQQDGAVVAEEVTRPAEPAGWANRP